MLAKQLKNYLATIPDDSEILVYVGKTNEVRQLIMSDIDVMNIGHVVIDVEYEVPAKRTLIEERPLNKGYDDKKIKKLVKELKDAKD